MRSLLRRRRWRMPEVRLPWKPRRMRWPKVIEPTHPCAPALAHKLLPAVCEFSAVDPYQQAMAVANDLCRIYEQELAR
jgi:hypothetical protein